jgi:hypothetical protein
MHLYPIPEFIPLEVVNTDAIYGMSHGLGAANAPVGVLDLHSLNWNAHSGNGMALLRNRLPTGFRTIHTGFCILIHILVTLMSFVPPIPI